MARAKTKDQVPNILNKKKLIKNPAIKPINFLPVMMFKLILLISTSISYANSIRIAS